MEPNGTNSIINKTFSKRNILAILGLIGIASSYAMRSSLSVSITVMVTEMHKTVKDTYVCPEQTQNKNTSNSYSEFGWSESLQGHILGAFYYGYIITHIPGCLLAMKFGGKQVFGIGIFISSMLTMLTPFAAKIGPKYIIGLKVLGGISEGAMIPALDFLVAQWVPLHERSRFEAFVFAGNIIGIVFGQTLTGFILKFTNNNWPLVFYIFGVPGLIFCVFWYFLVYSTPNDHPSITEEERNYIQMYMKRYENPETLLKSTPWYNSNLIMMKSGPMFGLICGQIAHDWAWFMIVADLPKYLKNVLHFSIIETGIWSSIPFLSMWIFIVLSGWFSDHLIQERKLELLTLRKLFSIIAGLGSMLGMIAASYASCNKILVVTLFSIGMATMSFFYSGVKFNLFDLTYNYVGPASCLLNSFGTLGGIVSPSLVGYLIKNNTILEWRIVFLTSGCIVITTTAVYLVLASISLQSWNEPQSGT